MSDKCNHNCESCSQNCNDREKESLLAPLNDASNVRKVIAIVSGKGGVGKSLITSLLASAISKQGKRVAILDADITGPSIPKAFGLTQRACAVDGYILPEETKTNIKVMSLNLLLEEDTQPVVWRGAMISNTVKQFWSDVAWGEVDYMFVDMPPGTGDVPLTVFQSLPVAGIVIATTPQELVSMIVEKAVNMAHLMNVPILGIVENMSYYECPNCKEKLEIFGHSNIEEVAKKCQIETLARIPIDKNIAHSCDMGQIEDVEQDWLNPIIEKIVKE